MPDSHRDDDREIIKLEKESLQREKKIEEALHIPDGCSVHHHKRRVRSRRRKTEMFPLRPADAPFYA